MPCTPASCWGKGHGFSLLPTVVRDGWAVARNADKGVDARMRSPFPLVGLPLSFNPVFAEERGRIR